MKKIVSLFVVFSLMVGVLMVSISAVEPRLFNTSSVIIQHGFWLVCLISGIAMSLLLFFIWLLM